MEARVAFVEHPGEEAFGGRVAPINDELEIERDLFGAWCVVREWGRVGRAGQIRSAPFPTLHDAEAALTRQQRAKERRGYVSGRQTTG